MIQDALAQILTDALRASASELGIDPSDLPVPELSRPRVREHGDWATNVALVVAPKVGAPPRAVAETLARQIPAGDVIERVEVAGPGFVNLFLGAGWLADTLREILERGPDYGRAKPAGSRVQIEFLSANPTGPLHVGHARNAVIGDALANVLETAGFEVEGEYYFNDAGGQMDRFGASVTARYLQRAGRDAEIPEDGYFGAYIDDLAEQLQSEHGDSYLSIDDPEERRSRVQADAVDIVLGWIRRTLDRFGVRFDAYVSESDLARKGEIAAAIERLRERGFTYESDGALWFRATEFGDDKDRPLLRSDGRHTYFGADCAYLIDKFGRGFDHLIYILGADHHGDVARVKGAAAALWFDPDRVEMLIYQFVAFQRGGRPLKMSKRAGSFVTLDELIDEVGADAARFHLLSFSNDSAMTFDIESVKRQSLDNPVYYVQYAHARIASVLRKAADQGATVPAWNEAPVELLDHESEVDLIRKLAEFPELVVTAAAARSPHRFTRYAEEAAAAFHRFYTDHRIVTEDAQRTGARLALSQATKTVIASTLGLLGVGAPEAMERLAADEAS